MRCCSDDKRAMGPVLLIIITEVHDIISGLHLQLIKHSIGRLRPGVKRWLIHVQQGKEATVRHPDIKSQGIVEQKLKVAGY